MSTNKILVQELNGSSLHIICLHFSKFLPIVERIVAMAALVVFNVSFRTPGEHEDKELIVKPRGSKSGLRAIRASLRSCLALEESKSGFC